MCSFGSLGWEESGTGGRPGASWCGLFFLSPSSQLWSQSGCAPLELQVKYYDSRMLYCDKMDISVTLFILAGCPKQGNVNTADDKGCTLHYFPPLLSFFPLELEVWTERVRLNGADNAFLDHVAL